MTETITFAEFFQANKIRMSAARTDHNPHMEEERAHPMDHWKCLIRCGTRRMSVYFSMLGDDAYKQLLWHTERL
jgi:hypothetical protein